MKQKRPKARLGHEEEEEEDLSQEGPLPPHSSPLDKDILDLFTHQEEDSLPPPMEPTGPHVSACLYVHVLSY